MIQFQKKEMPGLLWGISVGKALGQYGKTSCGLYINFGKWNLRWEYRRKYFPPHQHVYQREIES